MIIWLMTSIQQTINGLRNFMIFAGPVMDLKFADAKHLTMAL
jgi:hypothetical protein